MAHPAKDALIPENRYKSVTTMNRITGIAKEVLFLMSVSVFFKKLDFMKVPSYIVLLCLCGIILLYRASLNAQYPGVPLIFSFRPA